MADETIEQKAEAMGWVPLEKFRGDKEKWVDAEAYYERGTTMLPIVQASERKLRGQLSAADQRIAEMQTQLDANKEAIEALSQHNSAENRKKMKDSLAATRQKVIEARTENDHAAAVELEGQADEQAAALRDAEAEAGKKAEKKEPTQDEKDAAFMKSPEWKEWVDENPWYGTDRKKTALSMGIADEIKQHPDTKHLKGKEFLDEVSKQTGAYLKEEPRRSKVETGGRSNGGGGGDERDDDRSYSDLPADAKKACDDMVGKLVGPNKAYKTPAEWRAKYATDYFAQE